MKKSSDFSKRGILSYQQTLLQSLEGSSFFLKLPRHLLALSLLLMAAKQEQPPLPLPQKEKLARPPNMHRDLDCFFLFFLIGSPPVYPQFFLPDLPVSLGISRTRFFLWLTRSIFSHNVSFREFLTLASPGPKTIFFFF